MGIHDEQRYQRPKYRLPDVNLLDFYIGNYIVTTISTIPTTLNNSDIHNSIPTTKLLRPNTTKPGGLQQHAGATIIDNAATQLPLYLANPKPRRPLMVRHISIHE